MPKLVECRHGAEKLTVREALELREGEARVRRPPPKFCCPSCRHQIYAHKTGTTGQQAHFEHRPRNPECKLMA